MSCEINTALDTAHPSIIRSNRPSILPEQAYIRVYLKGKFQLKMACIYRDIGRLWGILAKYSVTCEMSVGGCLDGNTEWFEKSKSDIQLKRQSPIGPALKYPPCLLYFLIRFLPNPARPIRPVPSKKTVAGSGTGAVCNPDT